jgi:hypothetical protein
MVRSAAESAMAWRTCTSSSRCCDVTPCLLPWCKKNVCSPYMACYLRPGCCSSSARSYSLENYWADSQHDECTHACQHVCLRTCLQCDQWTAAKPRTAIATGTRHSLNCRPCYHCCSNPVIGEISRRDSLHKGVYQHHPWLQLSHGVCLKVQKLQQHMGVFHAKARANAFKETIQVVALDYRCVCNYQF